MSCNKEYNRFFLDTFQWWFLLDDEVYKWIDRKSQLTTWLLRKFICFAKLLFVVKEFSYSLHCHILLYYKVFTIWVTFHVRKILHFMLKLLHYDLMLHFASRVVTFLVKVTFWAINFVSSHPAPLPPPTITTSPNLVS